MSSHFKSHLNFLRIGERKGKRGGAVEVFPQFVVNQRKDTDLMTRGNDFYAVWIEERGLWSTIEQDALDLIDSELDRYVQENLEDLLQKGYTVLYMWDAQNKMIDVWHHYVRDQLRSNYSSLDETIIFSNTPTAKTNYASKRLPYPLETGDYTNWDHLISTLYSPEERHKIEWAIGAIVTGGSKDLQKFLVLYGSAGTGKSTILNVIQKLFEGYCSVFDAKALGSSNSSFALEPFRSNPLVAIQHDGDLSHIEDNTRLNSIVSHEDMTVNEKFKSSYTNRFKCILLMGTNKPVKITDAKSGLLRRLIDVTPSGNKLPPRDYKKTTKAIDFELGAIASHCSEVYLEDPDFYDSYVPINMLGASNDFYNYVLDSYLVFKKDDSTSLKSAWELYKVYCDEAKVPYPFSQRVFKEELKNYFETYSERGVAPDGSRVRSYYEGFRADKFEAEVKPETPNIKRTIEFGAFPSKLDDILSDCPAQYASSTEKPLTVWDGVVTKLRDLDTSKLHYTKVPENHIVIDFDMVGEDGKKSFEKNLEAASQWPTTYAELSKSGAGIHLHYIYPGDVSQLSRLYADHIEVKVFTGNSSLRRKLTKCNNEPVAVLTSGLPLKEKKAVVNKTEIKSAEQLRDEIMKVISTKRSPFGNNTKPCIDYIDKLLTKAYESGMPYDVSNMYNKLIIFANSSSNQAPACRRIVANMKIKSDIEFTGETSHETPIAIFDIEVLPNLFLVCYKELGLDQPVVKLFNPTRAEIERVLSYNLIGFNNIAYDNNILYAGYLGKSPYEIFKLSDAMINKNAGRYPESKHLSYSDIYDYAAKKQSLKKWEIEISNFSESELLEKGFSEEEVKIIKRGGHHKELGYPWDQPLPEERWGEVADYCANDVIATEALFVYLKADFTARKILADIAGMTPNDRTNDLTTRIIFGKNRHPQLVYTHLEDGRQECPPDVEPCTNLNAFPGYEFKDGHNMYRGVDLGYGGYVYSEPGMYTNVALLDVASLHPHSIKAMNCFGKYTKNFTDLIDARIYIKHKDYDSAKKLFDGKLAKYLDDPKLAKQLSQALKIAINSVYGLTSASFENPFYDIRNRNNIVALRGALFMKTLQDEVVKRGFTVAHIKTDSIKIPNATPEIIDFCMEFAKQYGYTFEHEATYEKMCLVNKAVYIAKYSNADVNGDHKGSWTATGTQFMVPYVFKTLFSHEPILFQDKCETKSVKTSMYLDMNESMNNGEHDRRFVGKVGRFCPIKPGRGGGELVAERVKKGSNEPSYDAVVGSKGYRWLEAEDVDALHMYDSIDERYYKDLVDEAVAALREYGDVEWFVADEDYIPDFPPDDVLPF